MKKLLVLAVAIALASFVVSDLRAESGSELEISGNVTTVTGWQHARNGARQNPATAGLLGDGLAAMGGGGVTAAANGITTFGFFIDQVELDLAKSFGENIRIRADLDFTPAGPGKGGALGGSGDVLVEQAYTTANIPAGNGIELLVGRFNSGIGLDPIDRNEMKTISHNMIHRDLLPHNLTGTRLGYDFNDRVRWEAFIVNDLGDRAVGATSGMPSLGSNLSYAWGDEGNKSWVKFSAAGGPERATKAGWSFLGDLSASVAATEAFNVGVEGTYRQDDNAAPGNAQFFGGDLQGTYAFSDVWDGTLRYSYLWDLDTGQVGTPTVTGTNENRGVPGLTYAGQNHEITLATGYQITEGARFGLEGRLDLAPSSTGGVASGMGFGLGGTFAYSF